jgi:hypothetical protein
VNGHGFTVAMATFAVCVISAVLLGSAMVISGTAKEVQELAPAPKKWQKSQYGATHAGVGFANYVVGNAVQSFWQKEMGKQGPQKMTGPSVRGHACCTRRPCALCCAACKFARRSLTWRVALDCRPLRLVPAEAQEG